MKHSLPNLEKQFETCSLRKTAILHKKSPSCIDTKLLVNQHSAQYFNLPINSLQQTSTANVDNINTNHPHTNVFHIRKSSEASENSKRTIEIFQQNLKSRRDFLKQENMRGKAMVNPLIRGDHSPVVVKYLTNWAQKEYNDKKKSNENGLMYINELWDYKYEKKTINSCKIDKKLLRIERRNSPRINSQGSRGNLFIRPDTTISSKMQDSHINSPLLTSLTNREFNFDVVQHHGTLVEEIPHEKEKEDLTQSRQFALTVNPLEDKRIPTTNSTNTPILNKRALMKLKLAENPIQTRPSISTIPPQSARNLYPYSSRDFSPLIQSPSRPTLRLWSEKDVDETSSVTKKSEGNPDRFLRKVTKHESKFSIERKEELRVGSRGKFEIKSPVSLKGSMSARNLDPLYFMESPLSARESIKNRQFLQEKEKDINQILGKCDIELQEKEHWKVALKNFGEILKNKEIKRKKQMKLIERGNVVKQCKYQMSLKRTNEGTAYG